MISDKHTILVVIENDANKEDCIYFEIDSGDCCNGVDEGTKCTGKCGCFSERQSIHDYNDESRFLDEET